MNKLAIATLSVVAAAVFADARDEVKKPGKMRMLERTGGVIEQALPQGASVISIVNPSADGNPAVVGFASMLRRTFGIPTVLGAADNAAITILLKDNVDFVVKPATGVVEIPLGKDAEETVENLWQGLLMVLACNSEPMSQSGSMLIVQAISKCGIPQIRRTTYRKACEEGWAPAPTNDYQKAIWEEVKAAATNAPASKAE